MNLSQRGDNYKSPVFHLIEICCYRSSRKEIGFQSIAENLIPICNKEFNKYNGT